MQSCARTRDSQAAVGLSSPEEQDEEEGKVAARGL